jgi:hypothetical protein
MLKNYKNSIFLLIQDLSFLCLQGKDVRFFDSFELSAQIP